MIGVPGDPIETTDQLTSYKQQFSPAYRMVMADSTELASIQNALKKGISFGCASGYDCHERKWRRSESIRWSANRFRRGEAL